MTSSGLDKDRIVEALAQEWEAIVRLMQGLSDDAWHRASILPGWDVQDIVAHMIGTESQLEGETAPPPIRDVKSLEHVKNDIAAMNQQWIDSMRDTPPAEVLERFRAVTATRLKVLYAMTEAEFDAPSWTPAGQGTFGRFMRIRVYDCWLHEQDIRDSLGEPGHESGLPAEVSLDEVQSVLGFIVGKKAGAGQDTGVTFNLTGGTPRTINVEVKGRATVVDTLESPPAVTLGLPSGLLIRLGGGRVEPESVIDQIDIVGDQTLGSRIVASMPFTI